MSDPVTSEYVDGSAFHHYRGYMSGMNIVHRARPDKNIYFTEQMLTERPGSETINIASAVKRLIVNVTRNWSKNSILWNYAADPQFDPHTDNGGCSMCQGAITIDGDKVTRNIAYYTIAHASKFIRPGSVRISSTDALIREWILRKMRNGRKFVVLPLLNIAMYCQMLRLKLLRGR